MKPEPEIWVPVAKPRFVGKRVNSLRDERGLLYVYIIILVCMGVGRGVQGDLGPTGF